MRGITQPAFRRVWGRGTRLAMDALVSAVAGDLVSRLISFVITKYQEHGATDTAVKLQRALVRAGVVVEEAEGRQITSRAMLQQLNQLRRQLCCAAYALDVLRWGTTNSSRNSRRSQTMMSRSRSHTRPPPSRDNSDVLPAMVEALEAVLSDMREFIVLLGGCPRVTRQPYNAYLFMETCMFGRQMEKEEVICFLLRPCQDLAVLPIIGPREVGKRTLVEHACLDERSLIVIDVVDDGDADTESWTRFHSAVQHRAKRGDRIIVISRTERHASLGTVPPLSLHPPRREELWYFFRALAFGPTDPDNRSDLARIAMVLCEGIDDFALFAATNIIAASLRADMTLRSWRRVLKVFSEATMLQLGAVSDRLEEDKGYLSRPVSGAPHTPCLFYNRRKLTGVARSELPKVTMLELLSGDSLRPAEETRFDVLVWQSRIPPYASYVARCDTNSTQQQHVAAAKKRLLHKRRRDQQQDDTSN
ncbi:hypothetical protein PR202_gn00750 [Eleusine coracana subsp. coracana]|uniref:Rx N-terminal domain-containing protein n=1 Tax=Eleusine coracana subsp. coracana TaxID=191504 RepID=A0AAV5G4S0_ELECO|nr:hypothetical protein PR202_gn00750 [Eleusine coracana subsp. coracana]